MGGFDEHTFLYAEEPILTERFREKGYKIWYTNEVKIIHEQGVSTTDRTKTGIENLLVKGRESLIRKCTTMKSIGIVPDWIFFWQNGCFNFIYLN